ncbi:MAG: hypothetical protein ACI9XB_004583 [Gammaproteobacteria bacterium]|jgi:hypothetical protein
MIDQKKQIRPIIPSSVIQENISEEEKFQNDILRPIIKLQHNLILSYFEHYLKQNKVDINALDATQKKAVTHRFFKMDNRFKIEMRGLIIGLLTFEEFEDYLKLSTNLNKRINNMIEQRVNSCYIKC